VLTETAVPDGLPVTVGVTTMICVVVWGSLVDTITVVDVDGGFVGEVEIVIAEGVGETTRVFGVAGEEFAGTDVDEMEIEMLVPRRVGVDEITKNLGVLPEVFVGVDIEELLLG
jgi:hypothetical protein